MFDFDRPRRYAVMGNPVAHSKSPRIHQLFAAQFGFRLEYDAIQVDPGGFVQAVGNFQAAGGAGLNVTVPFKLEAFRLAQILSERARRAQAVNTLRFDADGVFGDNTDGIGLVNDITLNLGVQLAGRRVLLLGAGGAARGALTALAESRPTALFVANRTASRARALAAELGGATGGGFEDTEGSYDAVINATAASLASALPPLREGVFAPGALAYDMMYGDGAKPFLDWARAHGAARVTDGLGMLVEQAAESFFLWHGKRPETRSVVAKLRRS